MPTIKRPKKKRPNVGKRKERQEIYQTAKWKRLRSVQMQQHPICQVCEIENHLKFAQHVHHLDSYLNYEGLERISKAYDPNNLISVCADCHNRIHNGDLRGCESLDEIRRRINLLKNRNKAL